MLSFLRVIAADEMCIGCLFVWRNLVDGDEKDGVSWLNALIRESLSEMAEFISSRAKPYVFGCWVHDEMTEFRQPLQVQSHLEMPGILVQLGHIQRT